MCFENKQGDCTCWIGRLNASICLKLCILEMLHTTAAATNTPSHGAPQCTRNQLSALVKSLSGHVVFASQCYKSSKEQTPLLDVSLLGCSVVYKEKQMKRKEHKLKIIPVGGEAIVLGLQSKEQTEQWLKVRDSQ